MRGTCYNARKGEVFMERVSRRAFLSPFPPFTDWLRVSAATEEEMRRFPRAYEEIHRA